MTIRQLHPVDWKIMEPIIDSRNKFQNVTITEEYRNLIKEYYIKRRLETPAALFFGYFDDSDKLVAFLTFTRMYKGCSIGAGWAIPGLEKCPNNRWPQAFIDLTNYGVQFFEEEHSEFVFAVRPTDESWVGSFDAPGNILADETRYTKEIFEVVPPGEQMKDPNLRPRILMGTYPIEQTIYKYTNLNPKPWPVFDPIPVIEVPPLPK